MYLCMVYVKSGGHPLPISISLFYFSFSYLQGNHSANRLCVKSYCEFGRLFEHTQVCFVYWNSYWAIQQSIWSCNIEESLIVGVIMGCFCSTSKDFKKLPSFDLAELASETPCKLFRCFTSSSCHSCMDKQMTSFYKLVTVF